MQAKNVFYKITNLLMAALMLAEGVLFLIYAQYFPAAYQFQVGILGFYAVIFGTVLVLIEVGMGEYIFKYLGFLQYIFGKGMLFIFMGSLFVTLAATTWIRALNIITIVAGAIYCIIQFIPALRPTIE